MIGDERAAEGRVFRPVFNCSRHPVGQFWKRWTHQVGHPAQGTDKPEVAETGGEQGQQPRIVADVEKPHVARVDGEVGRDVWKDVLGVIEEVVPQLVGVGVVITILWDP